MNQLVWIYAILTACLTFGVLYFFNYNGKAPEDQNLTKQVIAPSALLSIIVGATTFYLQTSTEPEVDMSLLTESFD